MCFGSVAGWTSPPITSLKTTLDIFIASIRLHLPRTTQVPIRATKSGATSIFFETRGVGGIFFDDLSEPGFEQAFALMRSVGDAFIPAYLPLVEKRRSHPFGERERDFQAYRRGRYVEFNLVFDRGTLFGLQSGGRTESILLSMPPMAAWRYNWQAEAGSPEAALSQYLTPRDWV